MKGRTWVLVFIVFIALAFGGIWLTVKHYSLDRLLRERINEIVSLHIGGDFESSAIYITPFSFGLRDVHLRLSEIPLAIEAKRIRIEFNIISLLKNKFSFASGTRNVFLDEPRFVWNLTDKNGNNGPIDFDVETEISLPSLPFVRINIVKGAFQFSRDDSTLVLVDDIGGWLDSTSDTDIFINAEGKLLSDSINTTFTSRIQRETRTIGLEISSTGCDLSRPNIELITGDIVPESGHLNFHLTAEKLDKDVTQTGDFFIDSASFYIRESGIYVENIDAEGSIENSVLLFKSVTAEIMDVKPELKGEITLRPNVEIGLELSADDVNVGEVFPRIFPNLSAYPTGSASFVSTVEGPLRDLVVSVDMTSDLSLIHI